MVAVAPKVTVQIPPGASVPPDKRTLVGVRILTEPPLQLVVGAGDDNTVKPVGTRGKLSVKLNSL